MWGCEEVILEFLEQILEQMLSPGTLTPRILKHLGTDTHKNNSFHNVWLASVPWRLLLILLMTFHVGIFDKLKFLC